MKQTSFVMLTVLAAAMSFASMVAAHAAGTDADKKKPAQAPAAINDEYHIGPGDKLCIEVYKDPQLSQSVQVRPDGKITLPLVGDMEATGRTPLELRDTITTSL